MSAIVEQDLQSHPNALVYGSDTLSLGLTTDGRGNVLFKMRLIDTSQEGIANYAVGDLNQLLQGCASALSNVSTEALVLPVTTEMQTHDDAVTEVLMGRLGIEDIQGILRELLLADVRAAIDAQEADQTYQTIFSGLTNSFIPERRTVGRLMSFFAVKKTVFEFEKEAQEKVEDYLRNTQMLRRCIAEIYWSTYGAHFYESFAAAATNDLSEAVEFSIQDQELGLLTITDNLDDMEGSGVEMRIEPENIVMKFEGVDEIDVIMDGSVAVVGEDSDEMYTRFELVGEGNYSQVAEIFQSMPRYLKKLTTKETEKPYDEPNMGDYDEWEPNGVHITTSIQADRLPENVTLVVVVNDRKRYIGTVLEYYRSGDSKGEKDIEKDYVVRIMGGGKRRSVREGSVVVRDTHHGVVILEENKGAVEAENTGLVTAEKITGNIDAAYSRLQIFEVDGDAHILKCEGFCGRPTGELDKVGSQNFEIVD